MGTLFKLNSRKSNVRYRLHASVDFSRLLNIALFLSYNHQEQPTCSCTLETFDILIPANRDRPSLSLSYSLSAEGSNEYSDRYIRRITTLTFVDNWFFLWWRSLSCAPDTVSTEKESSDYRTRACNPLSRRFFYRCTCYMGGWPGRGKRHPGENATFRYCSKLLPKAVPSMRSNRNWSFPRIYFK